IAVSISNFLFHRNKRITQLIAGGGVALIGITLVPLLSGLFG
ncbi:MAG: Maff2 family protein, partial [bacterium]|nr:Maff2 family protein [bacterium]